MSKNLTMDIVGCISSVNGEVALLIMQDLKKLGIKAKINRKVCSIKFKNQEDLNLYKLTANVERASPKPYLKGYVYFGTI